MMAPEPLHVSIPPSSRTNLKRKRSCKCRIMLSTLASLTLIQQAFPFQGLHPTRSMTRNERSSAVLESASFRRQNRQVLSSTKGAKADTNSSIEINSNADAFDSSDSTEAPTAPEVNKWTTIMTDPDPFINSPNSPSIYTALDALTDYDHTQIEKYWDQLMPYVSYLGTTNTATIKESLRVAYCAHRGQARKSGEPFIIHPVEVSILLAGLKMDAETVMAGLLHDTVEDTDLAFNQIDEMFGTVVKSIVEGETKVSKLPKLAFEDYADEQAENLRQMFVAMTDDYRIIIVKLADRLHNMRTLRFMKPEKQIKISRETLDIFAPLAHRMGIWQFKSELEDTSFMYLYPREYKRLNRRLRRHQTKFRETLDKSQDILKQTMDNDRTLREQAVEVKVSGRTKELYSLWNKMNTKGEHDLDHITDVVALRVIIEPKKPRGFDEHDDDTDVGVWLCYHVLGLVQHLPGFQPVPTKVKDYISFPKPNGYQSLHTALMLNGQTIEVQIRTSAMHQIAEYGMASHWAYHDGQKRLSVNKSPDELYNTPWLSSIKEWQDEVLSSRDFVDCVRRELLGKRVFVFLRNGKILNLAKGATVIDAAFQIHTEVGLTMHGVEINGRGVSFSYELKNGDVVSVLTGNGKPATDWMRFAKIRSTRSKLRSYFRRKQKESLRDAGVILLMDFLRMYKPLILENSYLEEPFLVPTTPEGVQKFLPGKTQYHDVDDLLVDIGSNHEREFLRAAVAKIFLVSQTALATAEEKSREDLSNQIQIAVKAKRKNAQDVSVALAEEETDDYILDELENRMSTLPVGDLSTDAGVEMNGSIGAKLKNGVNGNIVNRPVLDGCEEIADPEYLCDHCLPILGDDIVGVRRKEGGRDGVITTVHRCCCPIAQQAINESSRNIVPPVNGGSKKPGLFSKNSGKLSITTRIKARLSSKIEKREAKPEVDDTFAIVKLKWDESNMSGDNISYLTELSVVAEDRKYLLADCSEVVSDMSEIVKTGSLSTKEHAIFEFVVKVESLDHLQKLMDSLMEIPSVMSVERKLDSL
uniref:Putative GTP diphosphokinase RSH1, chloroplastic n=1 Tax=Chaetoceros debilis TaxID=122233 RepID=A0A7S3PXK1_9STRA|mmetsp:Transcript_12270/g.17888  ORF Transcript_12270/g.17888 Transcript_12270/m.17888 type:complete len:1038 (-) Transcript_12270:61-3174(-)